MPDVDKHLSDCDWPAQRNLINYKLDTVVGQCASLNGRLDTVISNQAMAAGTDKYKKNFYPYIINIGMFIIALLALLLTYFRHA